MFLFFYQVGMDISDDSIIAPSGVITSTGNIPSNVITSKEIVANDQLDISLSQVISNDQDECLSQDSAVKRKQKDDFYTSNFSSLNKTRYIEKDSGRSDFTGFQVGTNNSVATSQDNISSNIIIIEPICADDQRKSFFNNDLNLAKILQKSEINSLGIKKVRKNISRKILIIELDTSDITDISKVLSVTKLGNYSVKCRLPVNHTKCQGVIGPVSLDTDMVELEEAIKSQSSAVEAVERIFKGRNKTPTVFIKISFVSAELPEYIIVGYQRFSVKLFIATPWQCYRCQGFGHSADHCRFKPRCLVCSGPHEFRQCDQKVNGSRVLRTKCPNCKGEHTANYGGCPYFKRAKEIEKIRAEKKLSYRDAALIQKKEINQTKISSVISNTSNSLDQSYSKILSQNSNSGNSISSPKPKYVDSGCQTEYVDSGCQTERLPLQSQTEVNFQPNEELLKGIAKVIYSILKQSQTISPTEEAISDSFNKIFGTSLTGSVTGSLSKENVEGVTQSETQSISSNSTSPQANVKKRKKGEEKKPIQTKLPISKPVRRRQ